MAPTVVRQAPPAGETGRNDPVASIIRHNDATEQPAAPSMRQQDGTKNATKNAKGYGAQDRQALDKLIEATGDGK
jgi:hypothetical protein